jgi:hypothetical protein
MGKGSSESSTTSTSATTNQDLRVGAEGGGIALGQGASYNITDNFPTEVISVFDKIVDFSSGVLSAANDIVNKAIALGENATNKALESSNKSVTTVSGLATSAVNPAEANNAAILKNLTPIAIIGAIALIGIAFFNKRKGK